MMWMSDVVVSVDPSVRQLPRGFGIISDIMSEFKLSDPFGSAPSKAPFTQSVSTGVPWHNLPITREYTLGQLLDQTVARCGENDAVVYADRDYRLSWFEFSEEVDYVA